MNLIKKHRRGLAISLTLWLLANALVLVLSRGGLPFDRPALAGESGTMQLIAANVAFAEVFLIMGIVGLLTRRRARPDLAARAPERAVALRETLLLLGYGVACLLGGLALGRALGWHPIGWHIAGTLFGAHDAPSRAEVFGWASYNVIAYAVLPFVYFRRKYAAKALNLVSSHRRNDLTVIGVVLLVETLFQLAGLGLGVFALGPRQMLLGAALTFALYFVGTVLPTMIFIYAILLPRYRRLTGSNWATVVLSGLTYTLMHALDAWAVFRNPREAVLSVIFLLFAYFGPGMVKGYLTLRTGNAWVHVWAYHAFAPHALHDAPLMVKTFGIK